MKHRLVGWFFLFSLCLSAPSQAIGGALPQDEMSISGIVIGDSPAQVRKKMGEPLRESKGAGFLDLHYEYASVRVSFSEGVAVGLQSRNRRGCTPMRLCPGDGLKRMRVLYGSPIVADREIGRRYEYYVEGGDCWLQIGGNANEVESISVACQP